MIKLLIITGPTSTGKTALGIRLAQEFNGEIISADSQQAIVGRDQERGKDKQLYQQAGVKIWGLDLVTDGFNVASFVTFARKTIADIATRGKLPIVVGGTGHYLRALLDPFATINISPDEKLRRQNLPLLQLQEKLKKIAPQKWQIMNPSDRGNPRRLVRAIEVGQRGGQVLSKEKYDVLVLGLTASREHLYQKITQRRKNRLDLVAEEFALAKKQFLYQKKYLPAQWFDIQNPKFDNEIRWQVKNFVSPLTNKGKNTLTT